jgi:hypothetical protein
MNILDDNENELYVYMFDASEEENSIVHVENEL